MERDLRIESIALCKQILDGHTYSFHMFRRIFQKAVDKDDVLIDFWYDNGNFKNMRLYKYLTELGYRKKDTILEKVK